MRLTLGLLTALTLHGALFGVAAAVLWRAPAKVAAPRPVEVEVEVISPRPDPIADSATGAAEQTSAPSKVRIARRVREVALVPSTDTELPAVSTAAPSVSPSAAPDAALRVAVASAKGGGAVASAQPRYHTNPKPDYPIPSLRRREEGIVLLNVQVAADGMPVAISLNRGCGHPLLDRAALDAVRRWTFEPARAAGVPVSSLVVIPVRFSLAVQP
jgi:protein TonB